MLQERPYPFENEVEEITRNTELADELVVGPLEVAQELRVRRSPHETLLDTLAFDSSHGGQCDQGLCQCIWYPSVRVCFHNQSDGFQHQGFLPATIAFLTMGTVPTEVNDHKHEHREAQPGPILTCLRILLDVSVHISCFATKSLPGQRLVQKRVNAAVLES
jgi:hypothetical protein